MTPAREALTVGPGFISCVESDETVTKFPVGVRILVDSGAEVACLSYRVAVDEQFPIVEREVPEPLLGFTGRPVPGTGEYWIGKTHVRGNGFRITIPHIEVVDMVGDHDLIIPEAWVRRYGQNFQSRERKHLADQRSRSKKRHLSSSNGTPKETRGQASAGKQNTLEQGVETCTKMGTETLVDEVSSREFTWDESVLMDVDRQVCGVLVARGKTIAMIGSQAKGDLNKLPQAYTAYRSLFDKETAAKLPKHTKFDHAITLKEGSKPPFGPIYSLSQVELETLREYLERMLREGKIRPSESPAGAPILFVPKTGGRGLRLCVDYRKLNAITIPNRYPLPLMQELQDRVQGATVFSKLDLKNGYNLLRIKPGDEWKTAFRCRYGHFEYLVMPFGLINAPASFQAMMNEIMKEFLDRGVVVYMDDILIYSKNIVEHRLLLSEVMSRLIEHGLAADLDKCVFEESSVEFLGYVISEQGLEMSKDKVKAIVEWEAPKTVRDVRSFLGFANFYRRFVEAYARLTIPLTNLTGKNVPWRWTEACQKAFDDLKTRFTTAPILRHFDPSLQTVMETDASDFAISGILSQFHGKILHPNAFLSHKMDAAERNYDIHDKEMLAIVKCAEVWRHYLEGSKHRVAIITDHANLQYFMTTKSYSRRQQRWSEKLSELDFTIIYRPGSRGGKPDALTRRTQDRPVKEGGEESSETLVRMFKPDQLHETPTESDWKLLEAVQSSRQPRVASVHLTKMQAVKFGEEFLEKVRAAGQQDDEWKRVFESLSKGEETADEKVELKEQVLWREGLLWIPKSEELRRSVLENEHDSRIAGHFGRDKTLEKVSRNFCWPSMKADVEDYVTTCPICRRNKASRHKRYGMLSALETPESPWTDIAMDFITSLPSSKGQTQIWVIVDRFTKMAHFVPLPTNTDTTLLVEVFLREVWRLHGLPNSIVSDRDSKFTSKHWTEVLKRLGIRMRMSTAFHPQTDGQSERINQTIEAYLRIFCNFEQNDWVEVLPMAEYTYNNSVTNATGVSPFFANYGYHPRSNWPIEVEGKNPASRIYVHWMESIHTQLRQNLEETRRRMGNYYDRKRSEVPKWKSGDKVWLDGRHIKSKLASKKLGPKMYGPFEIVEMLGKNAARLLLPKTWRCHDVFNVMLLEPYKRSTRFNRPEDYETLDNIEAEKYGDDGGEYEVEAIIASSKDGKKKVRYYVKWLGYPVNESSWEPWENLQGAKDLIVEFHKEHRDAPMDPQVKRLVDASRRRGS